VLADTFARTLAILGAVGGIVGTAVALLAYFRDRPRLILTTNFLPPEVSRESLGAVLVRIANYGRQPISIIDVGLSAVPPRGHRQ